MSNSFFAPVQIASLFLQNTSFEIIGQPADVMNLKVELLLLCNEDDLSIQDDETTHLSMSLRVVANLINDKDDDDVRVASLATVFIDVFVNDSANNQNRKEIFKYLRINGVSIAYAHARTCLMMLAGLTPLSDYVLPPILPNEYLKSVDED